jgi:hypothetical protein
MQLSDLIAYVSRVFTPPPKVSGRQTMIIPYLRDVNSSLHAATVQAQCQQCAKKLASHLYVWRKQAPERTTVKNWSTETQSFTGMQIEDFAYFIMSRFELRTADGREWGLDKAVAIQIWNACIAADSPLPLANWEVEISLKRQAARLKESQK